MGEKNERGRLAGARACCWQKVGHCCWAFFPGKAKLGCEWVEAGWRCVRVCPHSLQSRRRELWGRSGVFGHKGLSLGLQR